MKNCLFLAVFVIGIYVQLISETYTIDGNAYLEGETDHSGIEVFFQRVAPDNTYSYTVYTNSTGYYSQVVENGIYDVSYTKDGFLDDNATGVSLYSTQTLADVNLEKESSLTVIGAGTHTIDYNIHVESGDTLIIQPGARLEFTEDRAMTIDGLLLAEGEESNMIYITSVNGQERGRVWFRDAADDNSIMSYCVMENSKTGGIAISHASPSISGCIIRNNSNDYGAGINIGGVVHTTIENCIIENNYSWNYGGGIGCNINGYLILRNLTIRYNESDSGDGIWFYVSNDVLVENCEISYNDREGVEIWDTSNITFQNCNINNNGFIGIDTYELGTCRLINSNVYDNGKYGVDKVNCYNSIISNNGNGSSGSGVNNSTAENCNVYGHYIDFYQGNEYLGIPVTTNSNGDPCDAWNNISMDPKFVDPGNGDYSLQIDSPCIDAGTNTISGYTFPDFDIAGNPRIQDGDGNYTDIVDIGAYEYNYSIPSPDGTGTTIDPYIIADYYDLYWMSIHPENWDKHYIQSAVVSSPQKSGWTPIGNDSIKFTGSYDGQSYSVENLTINRSTKDFNGLFGYTDGSTISNVKVTNADVTGRLYTSGLIGLNKNSTITDCSVSGTVDGTYYVGAISGLNNNSTISKCEADAVVNGTGTVGCFVGVSMNNSTIEECSSTGSVTSTTYSGGITGYNNASTIQNSYSHAIVNGTNYAGGITGNHVEGGHIINSYSTGSVTGSTFVGGAVGNIDSSFVENSFWDTETSGQVTSDGGTGKTTAEMQTESTFTDAGWDFSTIWGIDGAYPFLLLGENSFTAPGNVSVSQSGNDMIIAWDDNPVADSYTVYSSTDPYASFPAGWTEEANGISVSSWTDTSATETKKFYVVVGVNGVK